MGSIPFIEQWALCTLHVTLQLDLVNGYERILGRELDIVLISAKAVEQWGLVF